jgi:hypothetical protein
MPSVSVLMAYHRPSPFLAPAVRSVLDQTWRDLELVLVDNGTGCGLEPLGPLAADERIRLVRSATNQGIAAANRLAMAQARGEFIALLDHDDIALPWRLERQVSALRAEPRLGLVSGRASCIDESGTVIGREFALQGEREQQVFSAYSNPAPAPSYTGRRAVFERLPWREEVAWAADYDFLARAAELWPMRGVPEEVLHYRVHGTQTTTTHRRQQVLHACVTRLLAARRRAGQAEQLATLLSALGRAVSEPPAPQEAYAWFARRSLAEGFPLLAVYCARKAFAEDRSPRRLAAGCALLLRASACFHGASGQLVRMFFTGPLRTHGLRPA